MYKMFGQLLYFFLYWLFYRWSKAHNKQPTSDKQHDPTTEHHNSIFYKLVRWYEQLGNNHTDVEPSPNIPLPSLKSKYVTQEKFQYMTHGKTKPIVLKGLIKDSDAVKTWDRQFFIDNYGSTELLTLVGKSNQAYTSFTQKLNCEYVKIGEVLRPEEDKKYYINNVTEIFNMHPELVSNLNLDQIKRVDTNINSKSWLKLNMFMSANKSTGSSLHAAVAGNYFFNLCGRKKWILIDSKYARYLKTTPSKDFGFVISGYDLENPEHLKEISWIPKYEVILEPGDCLFVPPWFFHYVKNETEFTIGVAVRDHTVYWQSWKNNWIYMLMSPYWYKLHPWFLSTLTMIMGRKFLLDKSMQSDKYIMQHLAGDLS